MRAGSRSRIGRKKVRLMSRHEPWIVFYGPNGEELCSFTVRGMMDDEIQETISLLAYEHGIPEGSISFAEVTR